MTGKRKVLISGIAVVVIAVFFVIVMPDWFAQRGATEAKDAREDKAPDFILKDIHGGKFRLNDQRGKPVLLIFGTTWCPSCREEIPHLKDIYAQYAKKGLIMINIDIQESRDKVSRYADKYELPYRVLLDEKGDVAKTYGIRGVPTLILLDKEGMIAGGQRFIDQILAKNVRGEGILYANIVNKRRSNTNPKRSMAVITGQHPQKMMAFDGTHVLRHH